MRKLVDILNSAFAGWNGEYLSEPAHTVLRELATDGRFDDITEVLLGFKKKTTAQQMAVIVGRVPGVICQAYMYPSSGVAHRVLDAHWNGSGMAGAVLNAAMREGLLHITVEKVVERLKEIEHAQAQQGAA